MSEKFLMPSLENITKKYKLSDTIAGILIAFGISVPELAVTLLSFQRHGVKMTEFGLATVFGSVCFCTTIVPAIAHLLNYGLLEPRPLLTAEELVQN
jgi:Ca2+/Na+ antiporter